jgi:glycosyltransferase involved in cell wall biosynthesis/uncharacterized protein VirK/YbjX
MERTQVPAAIDGPEKFHDEITRAVAERPKHTMDAVWHFIRESPLGFAFKFFNGSNWDEPILSMLREHVRFIKIMRLPHTRALLRHYPMVAYRYFGTYLATSFTKKVRREILKSHYLYLTQRVRDTFFLQVLRDRPRLWQTNINEDVFAITLSFTHKQHYEGDLLLEFEKNGMPLYHLSFTIAPGHPTGSTAAHVVAIGRIQGLRGQFEEIRRATKQCRDIALPQLLVAAAQGIADALDLNVIAGVRNHEQITLNLDGASNCYFDYDAFWETLLGTPCDKFYLMPVPMSERRLDQISIVHRRRTRLKRQFKHEIATSAKLCFVDKFLRMDESEAERQRHSLNTRTGERATAELQMRRLRVLVVHSSAELYGADRSLLDFVQSQAGAMDITVALPTAGALVRELQRAGATVIIGPVCKIARGMLSPYGMLRTLASVLPSVIFLIAQHRKNGFDIVYSNSIAVMGGALAARVSRVPHVWHVRENLANSRHLSAIFRVLVRSLSDSVICNSYSTREWIAPAATDGKFRVIWNGVNRKPTALDRTVERRRIEIRDRDILFVLVGRINSWKGQRQLVQAFAQLIKGGAESARLAIVGSPVPGQERYESELRALIAETGCSSQIRLLPFQDEIDWVWAASDIAVVSSTQPEPFGRVAIEAMAAGLPVIAAAHGGLVEIVQDRITGLLYKPTDVRALLHAMRQLWEDQEMRERMGEAGRERQKALFMAEGYAQKVAESLRQAAVGIPQPAIRQRQ